LKLIAATRRGGGAIEVRIPAATREARVSSAARARLFPLPGGEGQDGGEPNPPFLFLASHRIQVLRFWNSSSPDSQSIHLLLQMNRSERDVYDDIKLLLEASGRSVATLGEVPNRSI
jgi:hypothetical protein